MNLAQKIEKNWNLYQKNWNEMIRLKNKGEDYSHLLKKEKKLNNGSIHLKAKAGILAKDPCSTMSCKMNCRILDNCNLLNIIRKEETKYGID